MVYTLHGIAGASPNDEKENKIHSIRIGVNMRLSSFAAWLIGVYHRFHVTALSALSRMKCVSSILEHLSVLLRAMITTLVDHRFLRQPKSGPIPRTSDVVAIFDLDSRSFSM
jgi:hypothetical protein